MLEDPRAMEIMEQEREELEFEWRINYETNGFIWTTQKKEKLLISEMSDSHIQNSINLLEKKRKKAEGYMPLAYQEVLFYLKLEKEKRSNKKNETV